jgi:hypothetical protein
VLQQRSSTTEQGSVIIEGDVWRRLVRVLERLDTNEARELLREMME